MAPKKGGKEPVEETPPEPLEGIGVYYFEDGSRYEGGWVKEGLPPVIKRKGEGVYTEGNNKYEGHWENDEMSGQGIFHFASGAVYNGQWLHNQFDGMGTYSWPDGSVYEGMWRCNKMHGEGMYSDVNCQRWHGKFYNGTGPGLNKELV